MEHNYRSSSNKIDKSDKYYKYIAYVSNKRKELKSIRYNIKLANKTLNDINNDIVLKKQELDSIEERYNEIKLYEETVKNEAYKLRIINSNHMLEISETKRSLLNIIQDIKDNITYICILCREHPINVCNIPCGHTFCHTCILKDGGRICPLCRIDIEYIQKIYI